MPLFASDGSPAGQVTGGVSVGLFTANSTTPFAVAVLRTDANGYFFASVNGGSSSASVEVPGSQPGQPTPLTVRAWTTATGSFDAAQATQGAQWGEWTFTSQPLGGTNDAGIVFPTPGMTGWGTENGSGFELSRSVGSNWGRIIFSNRAIPKTNGNGTYDVPLSIDTIGLGNLLGGVRVGLFTPDGLMIASTTLGKDANAYFFDGSAVQVPGVAFGVSTVLIVRVWQTTNMTFAQAKSVGNGWAEWSFTTKPLGGTSLSGQTFPIPGLTGWGSEDNAGFNLSPPAAFPPSRPAFRQDALQIPTSADVPISAVVTLTPGFNLVGNPLFATDNTIGYIFRYNIEGGPPDGLAIHKLVDGQFITAIWDSLANAFSPPEAAAQTVVPGEAVFVFLPGENNRILTFHGRVQRGLVQTSVPRGYSLQSSALPGTLNFGLDSSADYNNTFFPAAGGDTIFIFNRARRGYDSFQFDDLDRRWTGAAGWPYINACEGFMIFRAGPSTLWQRVF